MSWQGRSLVSKILEVVSRSLFAGRDVAMFVDVDVALRLKLEHHCLGLREVGLHVVVVGELCLGLGEEGQLRLHVGGLGGLGLLLLLDLLLGPSSLAGDLHHVGRDAFRN